MLNRLSTVTNTNGTTNYTYDPVGNLATVTYPNGVVHTYGYDNRNRLTNLGVAKGTNQLVGYTYLLDASGHRLSVTELSGRTAIYGYDNLYRLTNETIGADPSNINGAVNYTYDSVGNRRQLTSTLAPVPAGLWNYDANDQLTSDSYDSNGNTRISGGQVYSYDFENHLIQRSGLTTVYDGDGNRVSKTTGNGTTKYLVDDLNPTGYAQVLDELQNGNVVRTYSYGLELINELFPTGSPLSTIHTPIYYVFDGHGSVRALTSSTGTVTDTYDYDAFGILIHSTGSTPNLYRYSGEQFDPDLNLYYNCARYLNVSTGRFWTIDEWEGYGNDPKSLHKYTYVYAEPVNHLDPSGHETLIDVSGAQAIMQNLASSLNTIIRVQQTIDRVRGTIDLVASVYQVINTIATGGLGAYLASLPKFDLPVEGLEMMLASLEQNGPKALLLAAEQPVMLQKVIEYFGAQNPAFAIFMPLPSPSILVSTHLKVKRLPVKLFFGGAGAFSGRLLGLGMIKNQSSQNPYLQFFRMDWHKYHGPGSDDLVPSWQDGIFHYHIPRPN